MSLRFRFTDLAVQVLQAYQDTSCNSVAWKLRLIELVVSACHDIAVFLYQLDHGEHWHADHEYWLEEQFEKYPNERLQARLPLPPPTLFWHRSFRASHRYPNGVAELAGYWTETQIFGGVVLFDRGESGEEVRQNIIAKFETNRIVDVTNKMLLI